MCWHQCVVAIAIHLLWYVVGCVVFFFEVQVALRSSNGIFLEKATFFEEPTTFEGGRLTLLKIVLSSLPVYFMSSLVMPVLK